VACLTIYDMCKSADRSMVIGEVALWEKTGGRSGTYRREALTVSEQGERSRDTNGGNTATADVVDEIDQLLGSDLPD
jgi:hypothetical protein